MKRFYKDVTIEDGAVLLDARPIKTPMRAALVLPNATLAEAVAQEWRSQGEQIDPRAMPFTGFANAAIDRVLPDPGAFAASLAAFAENELLAYRAEEPFDLVALQSQDWNPILGWAQARYDVSFHLVRGVMHQPQPAETLARLSSAVAAYGPFQLAALNPIVTISGSLVIALAVAENQVSAEAAFDAAHLDELWQARQWGEDELALDARNARRADFLNACRFLALVD